MKKHPSGNPIREDRMIGRPMWRIPDKGSVIPRLQEDVKDLSAVGFTARLTAPDDDE